VNSTLPPGTNIYVARNAKGAALKIACGRDDSQLAERIYQLWQHDGMPEAASVLAREKDEYPRTGQTKCHEFAFEFAYGSVVNVRDPEHPALADWKWCVAQTESRELHSWIEHAGEGFDSIMALADDRVEQLVYVRSATELREFYRVVAIQSRTLREFAAWMATPRGKLFSRYPTVARIAADMRRHIADSGRLLFR
jgi:hypothetical protein